MAASARSRINASADANFRLKFAPDSIEVALRRAAGTGPMGIVMSIERPPRDRMASRGQPANAQYADNVRPLHRDKVPLQDRKPLPRGGKFPSVSGQEAAKLQADDTPRQETNDVLVLLEENARLRKLAVRLSNILGDLPAKDA